MAPHRKSRKTHRAKRKQTKRKQKGGFLPSIYGGVQSAGILLPLAVRQGYRLLSNRKRNTRRRKH